MVLLYSCDSFIAPIFIKKKICRLSHILSKYLHYDKYISKNPLYTFGKHKCVKLAAEKIFIFTFIKFPGRFITEFSPNSFDVLSQNLFLQSSIWSRACL